MISAEAVRLINWVRAEIDEWNTLPSLHAARRMRFNITQAELDLVIDAVRQALAGRQDLFKFPARKTEILATDDDEDDD